MDKAWTSARHLPTPCPHSALSRPHPHRFNNMILVITVTGAFGAIASARTGGRAAPCLMRSSPPRPIPHCTVTRARLRSQPAGRWPAPSSTRGETTPQTREREAPPRPVRARRNRGQVTQESRSSVPGIAVKCAGIRNPRRSCCLEAPLEASWSRRVVPTFGGPITKNQCVIISKSVELAKSGYLAEFEYRFNRRFDLPDIIPRLVYVALRTPPMPERLLKLRLA